jgi:3-phosphoglycerate kinase
MLIGGAIAASFLKALGKDVGKSEVDEIQFARQILKKYPKKIVLPEDVLVATKITKYAKSSSVKINNIPKDAIIADIGSTTIKAFKKQLKSAKTVFWHGPLGIFEYPQWAKGSESIARFIAHKSGIRIAGGGETGEIIHKLHLQDKFTYLSTSGSAVLDFIGGKELPGLRALERSYKKFKHSS